MYNSLTGRRPFSLSYRNGALALALLLPAACASNDPGFAGVPGIREAEAGEVTACTYISNVNVTPSVFGPVLGDQGVKYSRNQLKDEARKSGADTVVFDKVVPGAPIYKVSAIAYRCGA